MEEAIQTPSLAHTYNQIERFVKRHQKERGYIDLRDNGCDTINCLFYENGTDIRERRMLAIRVYDDRIQILPCFDNLDIDPETGDPGKSALWESLRGSDIVLYPQTVYDIAENLEEYVATDYEDDSKRALEILSRLIGKYGGKGRCLILNYETELDDSSVYSVEDDGGFINIVYDDGYDDIENASFINGETLLEFALEVERKLTENNGEE